MRLTVATVVFLAGCASHAQPVEPVVANHAAHSTALVVGHGAVTVLVPSGFPALSLDKNTLPDRRVDKEFWSAESARGAVIVAVWGLPPSLALDEPGARKLFAEWRDEIVETYHVELEWQHDLVIATRPVLEYRTRPTDKGFAMQYRYIQDGQRIVDLRFVANRPEDLDAPDVKAFFENLTVRR